jgi:hypothetical protein
MLRKDSGLFALEMKMQQTVQKILAVTRKAWGIGNPAGKPSQS